MLDAKQISDRLKRENSIALFCHIRPDGDTLGSALALKKALVKAGVKAEVFCDDVIPGKFLFNPAFAEVKNCDPEGFSSYAAIDCADVTRLGRFSELFSGGKNTYNIDHHVSNNRYAEYNFVLDSAANCENVFNIIKGLNVEIDSEIANLLATGIITDTGGFQHKNVTADTLVIASELVKRGADLNNITYNVFKKQRKERAKLFGKVMSSIRYFAGGRLAVATVLYDDFLSTGAFKDETEGFIDFVMGIDCVEVGVCVMETERNKFKCSFRSKGTDVNEIASVFGGGGHVLASGCQINGDYEEVVDKLRYAVVSHLPE